ncbi:MAG: type II CAAX endopeptidase family protein [Elusimicrobia bacterium]|nr:type II CAAX endopeptidase family protein [Elusimicrobiota bacterium]
MNTLADDTHPDGTGIPACRKVQSIELLVFLFLLLSSVGSSYFFFHVQKHLPFAPVAVSAILSDLALVSLVLFFVWRNGESLPQIGWTRRRWMSEVLWGLILFLPAAVAANLLEYSLHSAGFSAPTKLPSFLKATGAGGIALACLLVTVVAIAEETIFRGYLILRFQKAGGRTGAAVLLSSLVFSLGHGYEGAAGMVSVFGLGVVFALVYLWRRSLIAPIVMHFLTDFNSIVLVALLAPGSSGARP